MLEKCLPKTPMQRLDSIEKQIVDLKEFLVSDKDSLDDQPFLTKNNTPLYYKVFIFCVFFFLLCKYLTDLFHFNSKMLFEQLNAVFTTTGENSLFVNQDEENSIDLLTRFANSFKLCIDFIPKSGKNTKAVAMKQGKRFIDFFTTEHLKIVGENLKDSKEAAVGVLRVLQYGTRLLQSTCNDTKAEKDAGMMAIVPGLKRSLERFVFEIKSMLSANGALNAFFVGKYCLSSHNSAIKIFKAYY
jgi:hypothetical protein